ncbi:hypothetical protein GALMADRAFT_148651 [Galerina marginata CBS 339.88]|uniref:Uncharacterized protein n=1 Tax=Galerina marginata (strain CBS 339.88) TaxID=685588 RepID=A0A067S402_GALM3|nr:hypothetical protein GALMADRAFT_148651 [Galerina marginata CBS 339.88]
MDFTYIYVFFWKTLRIEYKGSHRYHVFECGAKTCKGRKGRDVQRFLDTSDAKSTGNMQEHAKICWGDEAVTPADATKDLDGARAILVQSKLQDGSKTAKFARIGKGGNLLPSAEIVCWVSENKQPFQIVKDRGFKSLMKTGRPEYYIPSSETVSRDIKTVFVSVRKRLAKMLQQQSIHCCNSPLRGQGGYLSITYDNATNNDAMIEGLSDLLEDFPGAANQTRCFTHVLNLIVKSIIKQFDIPEAKAHKVFDDATKELLKLAGDIDTEEAGSEQGEVGESGYDGGDLRG